MSNRNITRAWKGPVYQSSIESLPTMSVAVEVAYQEPSGIGGEMPVTSGTPFDLIPAEPGHASRKSQAVYPLIASLVRIAIGLTAMVAFPALAQPIFVPSPTSFAYENGFMPSVAISGTSVVEVHQGSTKAGGSLWSRSALIQADGTVVCAPKSIQYDMGGRPSVAVSGTNVIEVHEGTANGFGPLWYRTGQIQLDGSVAWSDSHQYDNGGKPSIAISGQDVIEVHQGTANTFGPLWFRTGLILPNGIVVWNNSYQYDNGGAPRVAMSGPNIIEVHQGTANTYGPLWYKTAQFQQGGRVTWSATAYYYDSGGAPAVSLAGATILEAHTGSANALGPLWFRAGQFEADGSVTWSAVGSQYDTGGTPSIALAGAVALEAHQGGGGVEMYHPFRY